MNVEALCRDGPFEEPQLSNRLSDTIPVEGAAQQSSMLAAFMDSLGPAVLILLAVLSFIGVLMVIARRRRLSSDLAMIESWGAVSFSELEEDMDDELGDESIDDMEDFPEGMADATTVDESVDEEPTEEETDTD